MTVAAAKLAEPVHKRLGVGVGVMLYLRNEGSQNHRITESQNHRIVGVGRDLCGSSSPTPLPKQGHLQ